MSFYSGSNSIIVLMVCVILCVWGLPVVAATHYLAPDGNDADAGTQDRPWKTLERASRGLQPGDTLVIKPGTYTGTLTISARSPADEPLTVRCEPRRSAVLAAGEEGHAIEVTNAAGVRIEGLVLRPHEYQGGWVRIHQSSDVTIDDCLMEKSSGPCPFRVTEASDLALTRSVLREYQGGNMMYVSDSERLVLEGNAFSRAGHALLLLLPDRSNSDVVIRGNVFHPNYGRSVLLDSVNNLLFEDNIITRSYDGGRSADSRIGYYATRSICRYNRFYDNWGTKLISISPYRDTLDFNTVRFYNNVIAGNSATGIRVWGDKETVTNSLFLNNVLAGNDPYGSNRQIRVGSGGADDVRFVSNVVDGMVQVGDELMTARAADQTSDDGQFADNYEMQPRFDDPSRYLYAPAENSPLIDAGRMLTHAVGNGSGSAVEVEDAAYFFDGFGIARQPGDTVRIGDTTAVVQAADVDSNILTLDRELQWSDGAPVSLPYSGSAPDIGAYEMGDSGRPRVEVVADASEVAAGETVTMAIRLFGDVTPQSVRWLLGDGTVVS
ncbi:MAG: nitrous oxide reductase family maturation protein NosD, partial [Armatimonadota bacterium]